MRILLTVAYDGTAYHGYQSQANGIAVQDVIEEALTDLFGRRTPTMSASRTDAGVHALGNRLAFDVETGMKDERIAFALNARLPDDIRVIGSKEVSDEFHPRFTDTVKTYSYHWLNRTHPDPLMRNFELHIYGPFDEGAMDRAARVLEGTHDFASFCAAGSSAKTTVRTMYSSRVTREGDRVTFKITGNGFLYNMIRIIAGTLTEIGRGYIGEDEMKKILDAKDRSFAGPTAPAKGLVLEEIMYPGYDV